MNGSSKMARDLCGELADKITQAGENANNIDIIVCPPAVLLHQVSSAIASCQIHSASQDIDHNASGAFTGQTAASMAVDAGAKYTLLGHSERRTLFGEPDEIVACIHCH